MNDMNKAHLIFSYLRTRASSCLPLMLVACALLFLSSSPALAMQCDNDGSDFSQAVADTGVLSTIQTNVEGVLSGMYSTMFTAVQQGVAPAAKAALVLYVIMYGGMFMIGIANATAYDFAMRVCKIAVVGVLVSGSGLTYFNKYVKGAFQDGMKEVMTYAITAASGAEEIQMDTSKPFKQIDLVLQKALQQKMWANAMATATTFPYGAIMGGLTALALWKLLQSMMMAMWVYLMAIVMQTLLFGTAPIFISCLLFDRTFPLFKGWLNLLANTALQPVLLFLFFAFFAQLMGQAMDQVTGVPACWTNAQQAYRGTPFNMFFWRFQVPDMGVGSFTGSYGPLGPRDVNNAAQMQSKPIFPIDITDILTFLILAELGAQVNVIVVQIARDLTGSSMDLSSMHGSLPGGKQSGNDMREAENKSAGRSGGGSPRAPGGVTGGTPAAGQGTRSSSATAERLRGMVARPRSG